MTMPMDDAIQSASAHARRAIQLDSGDADARATLAMVAIQQGDMDNALAIARQALAINPSCAPAYRVIGATLVFTGRLAEGREALGMVARLSPRDAGIAAT